MSSKDHVKKSVQNGITFGSALAMVISYANWHSVFWAIVHGLFSWGYVIYYVIRYQTIIKLQPGGIQKQTVDLTVYRVL